MSYDLESTGNRVCKSPPFPGKDEIFAIGSSVIAVPLDGAPIHVVESRRWVLNINDKASHPWPTLWKIRGYEWNCWDEFWSKNQAVLNRLMRETEALDLYDSTKEMVDSFARYVADMEDRFISDNKFIRISDTIGFDITNLDTLLESHGYPALFLERKAGWPITASFLMDMRRAALGIDIALPLTDAQKAAKEEHDALALPPGVVYDHDPANDSLCIAYKWVHYWKMVTGRKQDEESHHNDKRVRLSDD